MVAREAPEGEVIMLKNLARIIRSVFFLSLLLFLSSDSAFADLTIKDTRGMVRAEAVGDGKAIVEVQVRGRDGVKLPTTDAVVVLKHESGVELTQLARDGYARFDQVVAGSWTIGTATPGYVFTDIKVTYPTTSRAGMAVSAGAGGAALGAGLLGVAGVTAGTIAIVNHNRSNGKKPLSPHL